MACNTYFEEKNIKLHDLFSGPFTILLALGSIGLIIGLLYIPPQMFFTKHLLYIMWVMFMGIMMYPMYAKNKSLFYHVGLTTFLLLLVLSIFAYARPDLIKNSWGTYLFIMLITLLGARLIELFAGFKHNSNYSRIISYISIVVFSLYVMYDTKNIIINSEKCVNPDYINESVNLFLDSLNLFTNIYSVNDN